MGKPDKVFKQTYAWYKQSINQVLDRSDLTDVQRQKVEPLIWQMLGFKGSNPPLADPAFSDFVDNGGAANSLAVASTVAAESLVALGYLRDAAAAIQGGNVAPALGVIKPALEQVDRISKLEPGSRYPSAFSIGKILLMLSGDAQADPEAGREAEKLAKLTGADAPDIANAQAALGIVSLLIGSLLDRSFTALGSDAAAGWVAQALPDFDDQPRITLRVPKMGGSSQLSATLQFGVESPVAIKAILDLALGSTKSNDGSNAKFSLKASSGGSLLVPLLPPGRVQVTDAGYSISIELSRSSPNGAFVIENPALGAKLTIGELGAAVQLENGTPHVRLFARNVVATLAPGGGFLGSVLGNEISFGLGDLTAEAGATAGLHLVNGTGLHTSLPPAPRLSKGPFKLQRVKFGLDPVKTGGGAARFTRLQAELSGSFNIALGPFAASVDGLGIRLDLDTDNAAAPVQFALKPPEGVGLSLRSGIVKGGGFLKADANGYSGVLELKFLAVDVKAIAILESYPQAGFSLLLLMYGQFPPIQLSFGFTLTGIGGLIGVQHTASPPAMAQALSAGHLDAVLFPANPVANAPQIINTLRVLFPVKPGGFIVGPMLELGWGSPSLVTVRLGLLIEADQFTLLGQAIIQIPPAVPSDLALLYLRFDFAGSVVFDPLRIAFDAKLVNSRVAMISLTGQFAFRATFGDVPTFLMSAGGFHPDYKEIPSDLPTPFDRVGTSFDIGIVGVEFKGYFAITSATIQAGAALRVWADLGIARIEGGFGFDAICYLVPKFYFEVDAGAYLSVHALGKQFASVHLDGRLVGPGRWRLTGTARVHTPWPLPDVPIDIDQAWGTDRDTPQIRVNIANGLKDEIAKTANWSAQLPRGGDGFVTLADIEAGDDVLAHPLGTLVFQQKLVPFELRLDKANGSAIDGANEFGVGRLQLPAGANPDPDGPPQARPRRDYFATAQFLELSAADRLAKPSFEFFTAGYELAYDGYDIGKVIGATTNYHEVDLGAARSGMVRIANDLRTLETHAALLKFGAAERSPLRDRLLTQPVQKAPLRVGPAPVIVANRDTLATVGTNYRSVWLAQQARDVDRTFPIASLGVMEVAEVP